MTSGLLAMLLSQVAKEAQAQPDSNLIWQYVAVGAVFTFLAIWLLVKMIRLRKHPFRGGGCCGCSLADSCNSRTLKERYKG